jgi:hypothetical protein
MNDVELRDGLFQLFPPEAGGDWEDVLRRSALSRRHVRRLTLFVVAAIVAVVAVGSALALTGRLSSLFHGTPVTDLTPREQFLLSEFDMKGKVELIARRGATEFYVIRRPDGRRCYSIGDVPENLTPAQREGRMRFGGPGCMDPRVFPSRALPVLDYSSYSFRLGDREARLVGLRGFAADPVDRIGIIGRNNEIVFTVSVKDNVYTAGKRSFPGTRGIVALDEDGKVLWVRCSAIGRSVAPQFPSGGCGKYKNSPPPVLPSSARRVPRPPVVRTPVQRGSGDGVSVVIRGSLVEADLSQISPRLRRLLTTKRGAIGIGCFKFVRVAGKTFSKGAGVSRPFTRVVRGEFGGNPWAPPFVAPFDGCTLTGMYGHTWNDAHGFHDAVEIPLTAAGRRYFVERAVARDIEWLARSRVFHDIRYARRPLSAADAAHRLAPRVVPMGGPAETPPVGRLGIWIGPNRRIVLVERAPTGLRLYLEIRHGAIYRTNLGDVTG